MFLKNILSHPNTNIYLYKQASNFDIIILPRMERRKLIMNYETYKEALIEKIIELLKRCNDISLLDLIHKLLEKSM